MFRHIPEMQDFITTNSYSERQKPQLWKSLHSPSQFLLLSMMLHRMKHSFSQLGSAALAVSPPNLSCTSSLDSVWGSINNRKYSLCKCCSVISRTWLHHQQCFGHKSKIQQHMSYSIPAKNRIATSKTKFLFLRTVSSQIVIDHYK